MATPTKLLKKAVTFTGTTQTSDAFTLHGMFTMLALVTPSGWATADLTFQASHDELSDSGNIPAGATYTTVYDAANATTPITVSSVQASRTIPMTGGLYVPGTSFKIISSVNQTDKALTVLFLP